jgi:hypothetical protein
LSARCGPCKALACQLVSFFAFEGPGLRATDLAFSVERWAETFSESTPISVALAVLGLLFAGFLFYRLARRRKKKAG